MTLCELFPRSRVSPPGMAGSLRASALALILGGFSSPALAQEPATASGDAPVEEMEIVVVARRGSATDGTTAPVGPNQFVLNSNDWADAMAGTSALALVKNLPGVTFTSTDAYGLDLSDGFLLVRGFRQNELAITFEGIPLNDGSYGSVTGTAPLNIGVTDDIGSIKVAPGSAGVDTFSNSVDGGEMRYALIDPDTKPSLSVTQGYGSNNTLVTSVTGQTGRIGDDGPRVLLGVERISKDKYTDAGTQYMLHANAKVVQDVPWGDFTAFFSYSRAEIWGYNNTSFDMLSKLGWNGTDILYPNYARAVFVASPQNANASCGAYTCGELASLVPYDTGQATDDFVGNLTHNFRLSDALSGSVMAYGAVSDSNIEIADVTTPSQTGAPFSSQVWRTRPQRFGGTANLSYDWGAHTLSAGLWIERGTSTSQFAWYNQPLPGQGAPLKAIGPYDTYGPAFQTANDSRWSTDSRQIYVQDVYKPSETVTIKGGIKAVDFTTSGGGVGPDQAPNGTLSARDSFLPHLSVDWRPDPDTSIYADMGESMIGYRVSSRGNIGPVSSAWAADSQDIFDAARALLKPERDWNFTVGAYHDFGDLSLTVDAYYGIVLDRLLNGTSGPQFNPVRTVGIVSRSSLVGGDATVSAKPASWLTLSQSVSVSKLRYESDLTMPDGTSPLKGHYQPGYPGVSLITQVTARYDGFETGVTSTVYLDNPFTYTNDIYVPDYWEMNAYVAYHLPQGNTLPDLTFRLSVNNLTDRHNIGSVGIGGYAVSGDYQTFMRSAPRQFLFTVTTKY
ncbi:TonB-dependent receptor [Nitrospirillum sp. BR 11828]|uniref:TonB-dependent receptor n=1 Tax=Nitrospirillum sp. BR 11828 TaxID=3104325 RepID=UPI002ACAD487|nr:TonB-dependent receptor [Nitrospirillum sp. BR 11828]MDZ5647732.1 TonB-dependent receptor [Nitrospirillum sp. BR 11828]